MKQIIRSFPFIKKLSVEFFSKWKNYGFLLAWYNLIWWLCFYLRPPFTLKISTWAILGKTRWLDNYFMKNYGDIIEHFRSLPVEQKNDEIKSSYIIWVFWGQGEENMPSLVKACYRQLIHYNDNVILVTNENVNEYISLEPEILRKVKQGVIPWANYSDIIRTTLLAQYGGLWLDATVWISEKFSFQRFANFDFFSPNGKVIQTNKSVQFWTSNEWNWSTWCLWSRKSGNELFLFISSMLQTIGKREKYWPDYVIQDYLIYYACRNFLDVRESMEKIQCLSGKRRNEFAAMLNDPFDINRYTELIKDDFVFKLSFRTPWKKYTSEGEQTFYGYILSKNE